MEIYRSACDERAYTYPHQDSPQLAISSFMVYLKRKSSLMIFERHTDLKYKYENRNFSAKEYKVVEEYIRNQEKEYTAPF